jgi:biopolymer transport protein TolQ
MESFAQSGPMGTAVLLILSFFSIGSWAILLWKLVHLKRARSQSRSFLEIFRNSKRFSEVSAATGRVAASPLVGVFQAGYAEIDGQIRSLGEEAAAPAVQDPLLPASSAPSGERSRRDPPAHPRHRLATTAAAALFLGLFGTVWDHALPTSAAPARPRWSPPGPASPRRW